MPITKRRQRSRILLYWNPMLSQDPHQLEFEEKSFSQPKHTKEKIHCKITVVLWYHSALPHRILLDQEICPLHIGQYQSISVSNICGGDFVTIHIDVAANIHHQILTPSNYLQMYVSSNSKSKDEKA